MEGGKRPVVDRLVVSDAVAKPNEIVHGNIESCPPCRPEVRKRMSERRCPEGSLVPPGQEVPPKAERQLGDHPAWTDGLVVALEPEARVGDVASALRLKDLARVVVPVASSARAGVPTSELDVQRVAQHDLKEAKDFGEGRADVAVPLVEDDSPIEIMTACLLVGSKALMT